MKSYFINPGNFKHLKDSLVDDLKKANERILVAIGFLNDAEIIKAIRDNKNVKEKRVILNEVDVEGATNYAKKKGWPLPKSRKWLDEKLYVVTLGEADPDSPNHMHHKFVIIDNQLWTGTYNFTYGAIQRNWECMLRFPAEEQYTNLIKEFEDEFYRLFRLGIFFNEGRNHIIGKKCLNCNKEIFDSNQHFLLQEIRYVDYTVGYNYRSNEPNERLLDASTNYKIECINKHNIPIPSHSRCCDVCGVWCNQFDITKTIEKTQYINDGSVEFNDGYNKLDHQNGEEITYNCPKCFVETTMRSRYKDWWEPGQVIPDYF
ncbi:TPA: phospholipase D family protein [Bacillus cereus]|nr:phospholipase D family protein [Bacillus cereus]